MIWFDAHLDLACLAVCGRDMNAPVESVTGPFPPPAVTLPSLKEGGVNFAMATVFIEQVPADTPTDKLTPEQYREGDLEGALRRGRAQLEVYETWRDRGQVRIDLPRCIHADPHVGAIRGGMGVSEVVVPSLAKRAARIANESGPLHIGVLIEGADSVRSPDDLAWWQSRGVIAMGLAWAKSSRYAQGNMGLPIIGHDAKVGLSDIGRAMIKACDSLGVVHDLSHLSDRACDDLLTLTDKPVIASHSNARELLGGELEGKNQRHLRDATIFEIGRRGGVIGLNLFAKFLRKDPPHEGAGRPTLDHALDHIERVCAVIGHKRSVGLGSDMDGGFGATSMCEGIERPAHLAKLALGLGARGWTEEEIDGFTHLNWLRFWESRG